MRNFLTIFLVMSFIVPASAQEIIWNNPRVLFAMEDVNSQVPCIGATGDTCHFVWWSNFPNDYGYLLYCHTFDGGQTFSDTVNISGYTRSEQGPSMSVSDEHIYVSSTCQPTSIPDYAVVRHSHDAGMSWSDTTELYDDVFSTEVAACGDTAYVCWDDDDHINRMSLTIDGGLSYSHNMPCGSYNEVQDGCGYNGVGHFVGDKPDPFFVDIIHQRFDFATGEIGPETVISPVDNYHSQHPSIAIDNDGTIHVVWFDYLNSPYGATGWIYYRRSFDGGNSWDDYQILSEDARAKSPDIWVHEDNVYLVYSRYNDESGGYRLRFRMSPDKGDTWLEIESFGELEAYLPKIAAGNDNIYITYHMASEISNYSIFFLKGELQTEVGENPASLQPGGFSLSAYPNPFNASTAISFKLQAASEINLSVYDVTGRSVRAKHSENALPLQGWYPAGVHEVVWNAEGMPSGVYLVRLTVDGLTDKNVCPTRKVVLVK